MEVCSSIHIDVETQYIEGRFAPEEEKYAFAYRISISNRGQEDFTLLNRYWLITDGNGKKSEVRGPGVVGEQPCIKAGSSFQYTSGAILDTPVGTMEGYYEMESSAGQMCKAPIAVFSLSVPNLIN